MIYISVGLNIILLWAVYKMGCNIINYKKAFDRLSKTADLMIKVKENTTLLNKLKDSMEDDSIEETVH